jgi:heme oxygenase
MGFSRALLEGQATPRQLAALLRALGPAYALLDEDEAQAAFGATQALLAELESLA